MATLVTYPGRCAACHICELACSYHHAQVFSRRLSSIAIFKDDPTGKVDIDIDEAGEGQRRACDVCESEPAPLCVKWCPVDAILTKEARQ